MSLWVGLSSVMQCHYLYVYLCSISVFQLNPKWVSLNQKIFFNEIYHYVLGNTGTHWKHARNVNTPSMVFSNLDMCGGLFSISFMQLLFLFVIICKVILKVLSFHVLTTLGNAKA